jgi:heme-degrading monooxygenase HmoA
MSVVKINALHVPDGKGPELEQRFSGRAHAVEGQPGFESFQLLRPVKGDDRYFVVSTWSTEEDYQNWRSGQAGEHHAGGRSSVANGADLLEFETVEL